MSERDLHLLTALRHAPDREAVPPPEVTARILAAARDAVRPAAPASSPWQRLARWWLQPQVGAAFATLAVATLLGVMWSSNEPPAPASMSPASKAAPPPRAEVETPAAASTPIAQAAPATAPSPAVERPAAKAERRRAPTPATDAKAVAEAPPRQAAASVPAEPLAKADAAAPAAAPATPAPASPAAPAARSRSERAAANELGALASGRVAAPAALSMADRAQVIDPLQAFEAAGSAAWTWRASGVDGERAHGEPQRALWNTLRQATQGRWQAVDHQSRPPAPWLVLRHGPQDAALWLTGNTLYFSDGQGRAWRAPVTAQQARDWQQAVGSW